MRTIRFIALLLAIALLGGIMTAPAEGKAAPDLAKWTSLILLLGEGAEKQSEESLESIMAVVNEMKDPLAESVAKYWIQTYMDPDYSPAVFGRDDPTTIPVTGKHAFVVLGFQLDNGEMTEELTGRCDAAAAAARAFPESLIICSGGATGSNNPEMHTEAGLMKAYLTEQCGIDPVRILTDERAMSTADNARNTFVILEEQGIESITIVTSDYHQRRGQTLYHALAERYRLEKGFAVEIAGNWCYGTADGATTSDYSIAMFQLLEILNLKLDDD